jgi:uncharacterized protein YecE (DUF72 family)
VIRIGCSGWSYADWRERVYGGAAPARWLELYARIFGTVEVNSTFYRLAREPAVAAWVARTPPDFGFAVKASRYMTHVRRLRDLDDGPLARFEAPLRPLGDRRIATLWQLPPDFRRDDARLRALLELLAEGSTGRHAVEFRHSSWFDDAVLALLAEHDAALVVAHDARPGRTTGPVEVTAPFSFVRFHFGARGRRGGYAVSELAAWAETLRGLEAVAGEVLVYFNNDWEGFAVRDGRRLRRLLGAQV